MARQQLARGLWSGFGPREDPFAVSNGMAENLRLIDDHIALYTLAPPLPAGSDLPQAAADGDGQIFEDGTYSVYSAGEWKTYPARRGIVAALADGSDVIYSTGTGWRQVSAEMFATLQQHLAGANGAEFVGFAPNAQGAVQRSVLDRLGDTCSVMDFGAIGDGASHPLSERFSNLSDALQLYPFVAALDWQIDYAAIQAAVNHGFANHKTVYLPPGVYYIDRQITHTTPAEDCGIVGSGRGATTIYCAFVNTAGSALKFFNKVRFNVGHFNVNGRKSAGSNVAQGVDCSAFVDCDIHDITVRDVSGQGIWCISGTNEITNEHVRMFNLVAMDTGASGIQIQGARYSGQTNCTAIRCGTPGVLDDSASGVYQKVPLEYTYQANCTAVDCQIGAFSVGSSFPGVYARCITFINGRGVRCNFGIRISDVSDSVFCNMAFNGSGSADFGMGDIIRCEGGAQRNSFRQISVHNVANSRAAARFIGAATNNVIELSAFTDPQPGGFIASYDAASSGNRVSVERGYSTTTVPEFKPGGQGNIFEVIGTTMTSILTIANDTLNLTNAINTQFVRVVTEGGAVTDDLISITGGVNGMMLIISIQNDAGTVTVRNRIGNINLSGSDFYMNTARDMLHLIYSDRVGYWCEISRSDNQP
jgi:hypothetical protein